MQINSWVYFKGSSQKDSESVPTNFEKVPENSQ